MTNCVRDNCKKQAEFFDLTYFESNHFIANLCGNHAQEINEILGLIGQFHKLLPIDKNGLITVGWNE